MSGCCDPSGYHRVFSAEQAARAVRNFDPTGRAGTARPMVEALRSRGITGATVREVGAGPATQFLMEVLEEPVLKLMQVLALYLLLEKYK